MKVTELKDKLRLAKLSILASVAPAIMFCNALVVQAKTTEEAAEAATGGNAVTQRINKAGNSFWGTAKIVCKTATLVALIVCGLILIIGTQKMKETVKEKFYDIALGIGIIYLAGDICEWLEETIG